MNISPVPDPCHCGLFHPPVVHTQPRSRFLADNRCLQCITLRCDTPKACMFPHRSEDILDFRIRTRG